MKRIAAALLLVSGTIQATHYSITLDTGHTPKNYGALGASGITEYEYNRGITSRINTILSEVGVTVKQVPIHQGTTLKDRTQYAPDTHLFVSIHHDSFGKALEHRKNELKGYSLFVSKENPYYEKSKQCAAIIADNLMQYGEVRSEYHELNIKGENRTLLDDKGVYRYDKLAVLRTAKQPAVLVEVGVIANPSESVRLSEPQTQDRLSMAIAKGIAKCLKAM